MSSSSAAPATGASGASSAPVVARGQTSSQKFAAADALHASRLSSLTHTERMSLGLPYLANDPALVRARLRARRLFHAYNASLPNARDPPDLPPGQQATGVGGSSLAAAAVDADVMGPQRREIFAQLLGVETSKVERVEVEPPFWCDYGTNIKLEGAFYCNWNATILDAAEVHIGDGTLFGPNVHLYAATHSVATAERTLGLERALPIRIGRDCWLGGNVTVMAGVTIGDGVTVGAGSIVTRDIPPYTVAVGNPARVVKVLTEEEIGERRVPIPAAVPAVDATAVKAAAQ